MADQTIDPNKLIPTANAPEGSPNLEVEKDAENRVNANNPTPSTEPLASKSNTITEPETFVDEEPRPVGIESTGIDSPFAQSQEVGFLIDPTNDYNETDFTKYTVAGQLENMPERATVGATENGIPSPNHVGPVQKSPGNRSR
jgi:hypothetical protein